MKNRIAAIFFILLFSQCTKTNEVEPKFDLTGTTWILKSGSGEASVTGDMNGNGRIDDDDDIFPYNYFFLYGVESEIVFQDATTILVTNKDYNIHEEINYSIRGDEIKLESDNLGTYYLLLKVNGIDMILDWDTATFTKTYERFEISVHSSNIRYYLMKK